MTTHEKKDAKIEKSRIPAFANHQEEADLTLPITWMN